MKKRDSNRSDKPNQTPPLSFPESRVTRLLLNLKASLSQVEEQALSYEDWAQIAGRPANTIASWCAGGATHQLEVLLASMERLTEQQRHDLIDNACREYPNLRHRKLAHDFVACSHLTTLLRQTSGLTFIQGGAEHMRTFLLTALGNSIGSLGLPNASPVAGIDIHRPDHFVPVSGLIYLENLLRSNEIEREFKRIWPAVCASKPRLILLNTVWSKVPAMQRAITDAALRAHVVVADVFGIKPIDWPNPLPGPAHVVTVSPAREQPHWIRLEIQPI